jgi:hypothetical protein
VNRPGSYGSIVTIQTPSQSESAGAHGPPRVSQSPRVSILVRRWGFRVQRSDSCLKDPRTNTVTQDHEAHSTRALLLQARVFGCRFLLSLVGPKHSASQIETPSHRSSAKPRMASRKDPQGRGLVRSSRTITACLETELHCAKCSEGVTKLSILRLGWISTGGCVERINRICV